MAEELSRADESNIELDNQLSEDIELKNRRLQQAVRHLSRVPGSCPVSKCKEIIFPSNMMTHMLHKHQSNIGGTSSEIYEHKPMIFAFDPHTIQDDGNHCLATLMYGGVDGVISTQPGLSYLSNPNTALINENHRFDNYLPIMLMVCRSTWYAQLKDKKLERQLITMNSNKGHAGIYVFWLVAPQTTRKLYYTLTVFDRYYLNSRSVIRVVREYTESQNPSDFLPFEDNYLLLRDTEVINFMNMSKQGIEADTTSRKPGIPMELIIYEDPKNPPIRHSSHRELHEALKHVQQIYVKENKHNSKNSSNNKKNTKTTNPRKAYSKPTKSLTDSERSNSSMN